MSQIDEPITWKDYFTWLGLTLVIVILVVLIHDWLIVIAGGCLLLVGAVKLWRWACKKAEDILPTWRDEADER